MKLALIGNGAIARLVTDFCLARSDRYVVTGALGLPQDTVSVGAHPIVRSLDELLAAMPDLVVECAGHGAVKDHGPAILAAGHDLVVVSTGSLADAALFNDLTAAAAKGRAKIKLPAGALPGVDALAAGKLAGLTRVELTSSKPPLAWTGTPAEKNHDLKAIKVPTPIFAGTARDAALAYPKNANVAATAALAGLGFEATRVTLVADPGVTQNVHRLEADGAFGSLRLEIQANPSPDNPKTSHMAALSIMRLLDNETAAIVI
jgi:aspartate dehydrogenase